MNHIRVRGVGNDGFDETGTLRLIGLVALKIDLQTLGQDSSFDVDFLTILGVGYRVAERCERGFASLERGGVVLRCSFEEGAGTF